MKTSQQLANDFVSNTEDEVLAERIKRAFLAGYRAGQLVERNNLVDEIIQSGSISYEENPLSQGHKAVAAPPIKSVINSYKYLQGLKTNYTLI